VFLIEIMIEPKTDADRRHLDHVLPEMVAEDPTFGFVVDLKSGRIVLKGIDERQLDGKLDVLRHQLGINIGQPHVAYRETLSRRADVDYAHKKQAGGSGEFARVKITFEPNEPGGGYKFESKVGGDDVPWEFIPGVERGVALAKENGLLFGFPVIDFTATLVDGKYHDVDSSVLAFEIAARAAFRELRDKASPKLLEPIMKVEVTTPEDYVGDVIGDLNSRRGMIQGTDQRGNAQVIIAMVPLANMFGYVSTLRSMSQGRANFHMDYDHYEAVPQAVADEVVKKYA